MLASRTRHTTRRYAQRTLAFIVGQLVLGCPELQAQGAVLGTFRWQLVPYCNVVTLRVELQGATYALSGTDDRCGASQAAAANGSAHLNPNGSVSLAFVVIRPDGIPIATHASISPATLSGTWSDEYENTGVFAFSPASTPGLPRRITLKWNYGAGFLATGGLNGAVSAISFGRTLMFAPLAPAANVILLGGPSTLNCLGTFDRPNAAPGHLCLYEGVRVNAFALGVVNSLGAVDADPTGAQVLVASVAAGFTRAFGKWAVTLP